MVDERLLEAPVPGETPTIVTISLTNQGPDEIELNLLPAADWIALANESYFRIGPATSVDVSLELTCLAAGRVQHGWLAAHDGESEWALPVRLLCPGSPEGGIDTDPNQGGIQSGSAPLALEPPLLVDAQVVRVDPERGPYNLKLASGRDYLIVMPKSPVGSGMIISGGRNVVMVGGEIKIPWRGELPTIAERRGLYLTGQTGTIHLEGVKLHGDDLSEGIQLNTPDAQVQITNVAVIDVHARDQVSFTDNHPDLIQSFGGARSITVDRFTGSTDYQGLFFQSITATAKHGPVNLRDINIIGRPTARYLLWFTLEGQRDVVSLENVWLQVPAQRSGGIGRAVWPDVNGTYPHQASTTQAGATTVAWPLEMMPPIYGHATQGAPPTGNFVKMDEVGTRYSSPGYALTNDLPVPAILPSY